MHVSACIIWGLRVCMRPLTDLVPILLDWAGDTNMVEEDWQVLSSWY